MADKIKPRSVFARPDNATKTVVTHLGTIHSGNLLPDRHSWLVTRYFRAQTINGIACSVHQVVIEDVTVKDTAAFAGPEERELPS